MQSNVWIVFAAKLWLEISVQDVLSEVTELVLADQLAQKTGDVVVLWAEYGVSLHCC